MRICMRACNQASVSLSQPERAHVIHEQLINCTCVNKMTLYQYWQKSLDSLPDTSGPLSEKLTSATIHDANEAARGATSKQSAKRGRYAKFTPEQQAEVARYVLMYGNIALQRRFSRKLGTDIKESTICMWKTKYQAAVSLKKESSGDQDVSVTSLTSLPTKK